MNRLLKVRVLSWLAALVITFAASGPLFAQGAPVRRDGDATKAEIEKTLAAMSAAAVAGDTAAFMDCLDTSNAFFKQEQTAWCEDIAKNHPKRVVFALATDAKSPAPEFGDDVAHVTLMIEYQTPVGAASDADGEKARWPAIFTRRHAKDTKAESGKGESNKAEGSVKSGEKNGAAATAAGAVSGAGKAEGGADGNGGWVYAGEDWKTLDGDGFTVRFFKGSEHIAEMVLEAFPKARAHDDEGFGVKPGPQQIELFRSMGHLKATVYLSQPDAVLMGWNERGESIKFLENYARDVKGWTAAFAHEYGHVCTWEYGAKIKDSPWWVQEGVAELAAEEFLPGSSAALDSEIRGMAKAGKTVPWDAIADYDKAEQNVKMMAYHQGHHMLGYISERWGREGRRNWLKAMARGKSLDQATREVLGVSFAELDKDWRASLGGPEGAKQRTAAEIDRISALKAELNLVGQAMSAAAVSGDTETYLSHVYREDKEFLKEQTYFANDLHRKPAESCRVDIGDLDPGDGKAEGDVTWVWTMLPEVDASGEVHPNKERTVTFRARWIKEGGTWLYAGETWERHSADGVLVLCDPGLDELANRTAEAFTQVRGHVEEGFGLEDAALPKKIQKIKIYAKMRHLQQSICLSYEDGLSGWNEPGESIKLLASKNSTVASLRHLLSHEYGHVATFELGAKANDAPWWVLEGVAELSAEKYGGRGAAAVERWAKNGELADWNDLADFHNFDKKYYGHVYSQGHHMLGYISERWGKSGRNRWLTAMATGKTIDEATREAMGMSFAQLDQEWRATLPKAEPKKDEKKEEKKEEKKAEPAGAK